MGIEAKHAYRFGYLKSDKWSNVRLEALGREKGKCQICREESIFNDAHHKWYPENIYETTEKHLVILCRPCHEFLHSMMPECKTNDEEAGNANWAKFTNSIMAWRMKKMCLFSEDDGLPVGIRNLRKELSRVNSLLKEKTNPPAPKEFMEKSKALKMIVSIKLLCDVYLKKLDIKCVEEKIKQ
jgi:hypothetical protein